ncbi:MAG TPA: protein phosphatase 2C domain-containing protein, partial [Longimicrobium sp.]|nr:protein phosphatase 2C domain-containing protein [Longimicrobium sp.]
MSGVGWTVMGCAVRGPAHEADGGPCQDAVAFATGGDWLVAVLSDGAGSAPRGDEGSRHLVETVTRLLSAAAEAGGPAGGWEAAVADAVQHARDTLPADAEHPLGHFHATVVGVVVPGPEGALFFHIGDGAGAALRAGAWEGGTVSLPANGEYADQTYFYTEDGWRDNLRFLPVAEPFDRVVLVSDGAAAFAMAPGGRGLDPRFMEPVDRYLCGVD